MPDTEMEQILRNLPRHGTLIKDRGYRQVWRFEFANKAYYLKFYLRPAFPLKRLIRGNPAMREFLRLQQLQKLDVPAPRPSNVLVGFHINGAIGDAVVMEAIEPAVQLDEYVNGFKRRGEPIPGHNALVLQILQMVRRLGEAKLGHADLHLGNFLLQDGRLHLLDGYSVRPGGLKMSDVFLLGYSVSYYATRTDFLRGWLTLAEGRPMPRKNTAAPRQWRKFLERTTGENSWFGRISLGDWRGHYFKQAKFPRRWAAASALNVSVQDWQRIFPALWEKLESGNLQPLKQSRSGDVWAATIELDNRAVEVVVKRPYKRYWYRYINEIGRGSRACRAWSKAWRLIARNIPTAWPLMMLEKRTLGYVTDSLIIFERVAGPLLATVDLDAIPANERAMLFRRTGRILRQIDTLGLSHFDAKASNWIVCPDERLGVRPVLIDVDGIRSRKWVALGIERLLRSMREHPQYTPDDSLALCQGYAPYSPSMVKRDA
jgi:tRNA A-37 threonylcarbamoyl transferase component Bud32